MFRCLALVISGVGFALPTFAQQIENIDVTKLERAKVIAVKKDRTGKRFANRFRIECSAAGEVWETGQLNRKTRKMYLKAGPTPLRVGVAPTPGTVNAMINGTRTSHWSLLAAGKGRNFGSPANMTVICTGPGEFYAHAEWHRRESLFLEFDG